MPRGCHIRCRPRASSDHTSTVRCTTPKPSRFNINLFAFPRHVVAVAQGPRTHCFVSSEWNTAEDPIYLSFVTACSRLKLCSSIAHVHFSVNGCTHLDKLVVARGWTGRTAAQRVPGTQTRSRALKPRFSASPVPSHYQIPHNFSLYIFYHFCYDFRDTVRVR